MIRLATRTDINQVQALLLEFLKETSYAEHAQAVDPEHIKRVCFGLLHSGFIWLYQQDSEVRGLLCAVREQNTWVPTKTSLRELVWYVKPEYRHSSSAGRLFVSYCQQAEKMISNGEIDAYFTTRMSTTADYDLQSRGFSLTEKLYMKDKVI